MDKNDLDLLRNSLGKEPPGFAVASLEDMCQRNGLDWKARHCYLMERGGKWRVELSIDGFRAVANMDPEYNGQAGPFWTMGPEAPWTDIPPDKQPYASKVGVYRKGQSEPTWGVAKFKDYSAGAMWAKFPSTMIAKCAEMLALRKALPAKLGGLYGAEEMAQADKQQKPAIPPSVTPPTDVALTVATKSIADRIEAATTKDELSAIGLEVQKNQDLGLQLKMQLSTAYKAKKNREGWE